MRYKKALHRTTNSSSLAPLAVFCEHAQRHGKITWTDKYNRGPKREQKCEMKVRDVIRLLANDGSVQVAQQGSYRQFTHPTKAGKVTVPGKMSDDLPTGSYKSTLRQAGLGVSA